MIDKNQIEKAFAAVGANVDNLEQFQSGLKAILADPEKVNKVIELTEGKEAAEKDDAVSLTRKTAVVKRLGLSYISSQTGAAVAPGKKRPKAKEKVMAKKSVKKNAVKSNGSKKPGVIDTIVSLLQAGGGTAEQIATKLAKKFPDRDAEGLSKTVRAQLQRLSLPQKEGGRGLKIKRVKVEDSNQMMYSA